MTSRYPSGTDEHIDLLRPNWAIGGVRFRGGKAILDKDILSIVGMWMFLGAAYTVLTCVFLFPGRFLLWVKQAFEAGFMTETGRALPSNCQVIEMLAMVPALVVCTRYNFVAIMDQSETGYRYLGWNRWTGETTPTQAKSSHVSSAVV